MRRLSHTTAALVLVVCALAVTAEAVPGFGAYTYDASGNITSIGDTQRADSFVYDKLGRLQNATLRDGAGQTFTYDRWGNVLTVVTAGDNVTKKLGVDEKTNRIDQLKDKQGLPNTEVGSYDGRGNLVSYGSGTFVYDGLDRVKEATVAGERRFFIYTGGGERIATIVVTGSTTTTDWTLRDPSGRVLRRLNDTNGVFTWTEDYVYRGDHLLAAVVPDQEKVRHFHVDHLGTPRLVTGNGGAEIAQHHYQSFGAELPSSTNDREKAKFTGHERDAATLDYMHARYYDPTLGRFLSIDPGRDWDSKQPQSWNMYSYVRNNPVGATDPTGRMSYQKYDRPFTASMNAFLGENFTKTFSWIDQEMSSRVAAHLSREYSRHLTNVYEGDDALAAVESIVAMGTLVSPIPGDEVATAGAYSVYRAVGSDGVTVMYVGMTKNLAARAAAHLRQRGIRITQMRGLTGLDYRTARAVEQTLIEHYGLPNLMNKIYSIAARRLGLYRNELETARELLTKLGYL